MPLIYLFTLFTLFTYLPIYLFTYPLIYFPLSTDTINCMTPSIPSKLPNIGATIFTTMSVLAVEHNAINLGQGFPDFPMSEQLVELVHQAMRSGFNQYVHMNGLPALREALAEKAERLYRLQINPGDEITITPGGTYAIYTALTTVLQPGDEVIIFEPAYDSYIPNIEINGAIAVPLPLTYPGYHINWELVRKHITPRTRMIMLNSPHNPTGSVLSESDMLQLQEIVRNTNILILSDEVYEHLIFDGIAHQSILRYPELFERSFVCFSFGKVYHCTGWKLGYCIAPDALTDGFRKVHQFNCFTCNAPMQHALATYIRDPQTYLSLPAFLQQKRDYFETLMRDTKFTLLPTHGSYFQLASYAQFSNESDKDFATRLTKEYGVATIPVSSFYQSGKDDKVLRFCFAKKETTINKAVERLRKL
jgi:methionine transaminase